MQSSLNFSARVLDRWRSANLKDTADQFSGLLLKAEKPHSACRNAWRIRYNNNLMQGHNVVLILTMHTAAAENTLKTALRENLINNQKLFIFYASKNNYTLLAKSNIQFRKFYDLMGTKHKF